MNFNLISITSKKLSKNQINSICKLKNQEWRFGFKSQKDWFYKNVKESDIHNLFYINSKLIGYTFLRKRTCIIKKIGKGRVVLKYLYFDTLVIDKKFRKRKLSNLMMSFNNTVIKQSGYFSFLICKYKSLSFYKKNGWNSLKKNLITLEDHLFSYGMIFNNKIYTKIKYFFFIKK